MKLRTFIAGDMREALAQVRAELGGNAVIVSSQKAKGGGVMVRVPGWWKRKSAARPQVPVKIGEGAKSRLGADAVHRPFARRPRVGDHLVQRRRPHRLEVEPGVAVAVEQRADLHRRQPRPRGHRLHPGLARGDERRVAGGGRRGLRAAGAPIMRAFDQRIDYAAEAARGGRVP